MRSFQEHLSEFDRRKAKVIAISVDAPAVTLNHCRKLGMTYTFLSDTGREVIRRYDLAHPTEEMGEIARPAEFLIDSSGTVRWANLTEDYRVRARPGQILGVIDSLTR